MRKLLAAALAVGWAISLALPVAVTGSGPNDVWPGFAVLIIGPLGVLVMQFAWFANLLLVPAIIFLVMKRPPRVLGIIFSALLVLLALDALTWDRIHGDNAEAMILHYGAGYYLWLGVVLGAATALMLRLLTEGTIDVETKASPPAN